MYQIRPSMLLVVEHDCLLLEAPRLHTPALAFCHAGSTVTALAVMPGFLQVRTDQAEGFLPAALLRSADGEAARNQPRIPSFNAADCFAVPDTHTRSFTRLHPSEAVQVLGADGPWFLIQRVTGELAFAVDTYSRQQRRELQQGRVGFVGSLLLALCGIAWAGSNYMLLSQALQTTPFLTWQWANFLSWLALCASMSIAMYLSRHISTQTFMMGVFSVGLWLFPYVTLSVF